MTLISRNPFSRTELHCKVVKTNGETCHWCGTETARHTTTPKLMSFTMESDGGRRSQIKGLFCSMNCYHSYHR